MLFLFFFNSACLLIKFLIHDCKVVMVWQVVENTPSYFLERERERKKRTGFIYYWKKPNFSIGVNRLGAAFLMDRSMWAKDLTGDVAVWSRGMCLILQPTTSSHKLSWGKIRPVIPVPHWRQFPGFNQDWLIGDEAWNLPPPCRRRSGGSFFVQASPNGDVLLGGLSLPAAPEQNLTSKSSLLCDYQINLSSGVVQSYETCLCATVAAPGDRKHYLLFLRSFPGCSSFWLMGKGPVCCNTCEAGHGCLSSEGKISLPDGLF